jgi:hypothetical protein
MADFQSLCSQFSNLIKDLITIKISKSSPNQGIIQSVDEQNDTCVVLYEGVEYADVPLKSISDKSNFVVYPSVGTTCNIYFLMGMTENPRILDFQNCQKIKISTESETLEDGTTQEVSVTNIDINADDIAVTCTNNVTINASSVIFNDGNNGGIPITKEVVTKLNRVEEDINTLKQAFSTWVPAPMDGGAALKGATASWSSQQIQPLTQDSDIENIDVSH